MTDLRTRTIRHPARPGARGGFTLVEMLVSVALVVLMMLMFAQIFEITAGSISTQKGLSENDQRARMLTTVIKGDLARRTMRVVAPIGARENIAATSAALGVAPNQREGYVYVSENNPDDDTDDVLQFTMRTTVDEPLTGQTILLSALGGDNDDVNQPEGDDGGIEFDDFNNDGQREWEIEINPNNTGESQVAEASYFLRAGNLYRRVLLVRQPYIGSQTQPTNIDTGQALIPANFPYNNAMGRSFWNDFDYSAYYDARPMQQRVAFLDTNQDLNPQYPGAGNLPGDFRLVDPRYRFGHWRGLAAGAYGRPREFDSNGQFFGRFTQEETSHPNFGYPGMLPPSGPMRNPFDSTTRDGNPTTTITLGGDGVVDQYRHNPQIGSRRGDDLLLSNVHSFDVKLWDRILQTFVDVGHSNAAGSLSLANNQHIPANLIYGPRPFQTDTDLNNNNTLEEGEYGNRVFDTWATSLDVDQDGTADPPPYGSVWGRDNGPGFAGLDDDGDGDTDEDDETFTGGGDTRPIQAIQITIRYLDSDSGQLRQLTIEHSLVD